MINKIWRIIKFASKYWWILEPTGEFILKQSKVLYEKAKKVFKKPKKDKNKN